MAIYVANSRSRLAACLGRCELNLKGCTVLATGMHHVYPQRKGRDDSYENLRASCWNCNVSVEAMGVRTAEAAGLYSPTPLGAP
jgi:5-methylcytosine-specific restriction endonuclease McrA